MRMILQDRLDELAVDGLEVEAARFAGRQMSPAGALAQLRTR